MVWLSSERESGNGGKGRKSMIYEYVLTFLHSILQCNLLRNKENECLINKEKEFFDRIRKPKEKGNTERHKRFLYNSRYL